MLFRSIAVVKVMGCRLVSERGARLLTQKQGLDSDGNEWADMLELNSTIESRIRMGN